MTDSLIEEIDRLTHDNMIPTHIVKELIQKHAPSEIPVIDEEALLLIMRDAYCKSGGWSVIDKSELDALRAGLQAIRPYLREPKHQAQPAGEIPVNVEEQNMALVPLMVMAASEFDTDALGIANLDRLMTDALSAIRPHLREPKREAQPGS